MAPKPPDKIQSGTYQILWQPAPTQNLSIENQPVFYKNDSGANGLEPTLVHTFLSSYRGIKTEKPFNAKNLGEEFALLLLNPSFTPSELEKTEEKMFSILEEIASHPEAKDAFAQAAYDKFQKPNFSDIRLLNYLTEGPQLRFASRYGSPNPKTPLERAQFIENGLRSLFTYYAVSSFEGVELQKLLGLWQTGKIPSIPDTVYQEEAVYRALDSRPILVEKSMPVVATVMFLLPTSWSVGAATFFGTAGIYQGAQQKTIAQEESQRSAELEDTAKAVRYYQGSSSNTQLLTIGAETLRQEAIREGAEGSINQILGVLTIISGGLRLLLAKRVPKVSFDSRLTVANDNAYALEGLGNPSRPRGLSSLPGSGRQNPINSFNPYPSVRADTATAVEQMGQRVYGFNGTSPLALAPQPIQTLPVKRLPAPAELTDVLLQAVPKFLALIDRDGNPVAYASILNSVLQFVTPLLSTLEMMMSSNRAANQGEAVDSDGAKKNNIEGKEPIGFKGIDYFAQVDARYMTIDTGSRSVPGAMTVHFDPNSGLLIIAETSTTDNPFAVNLFRTARTYNLRRLRGTEIEAEDRARISAALELIKNKTGTDYSSWVENPPGYLETQKVISRIIATPPIDITKISPGDYLLFYDRSHLKAAQFSSMVPNGQLVGMFGMYGPGNIPVVEIWTDEHYRSEAQPPIDLGQGNSIGHLWPRDHILIAGKKNGIWKITPEDFEILLHHAAIKPDPTILEPMSREEYAIVSAFDGMGFDRWAAEIPSIREANPSRYEGCTKENLEKAIAQLVNRFGEEALSNALKRLIYMHMRWLHIPTHKTNASHDTHSDILGFEKNIASMVREVIGNHHPVAMDMGTHGPLGVARYNAKSIFGDLELIQILRERYPKIFIKFVEELYRLPPVQQDNWYDGTTLNPVSAVKEFFPQVYQYIRDNYLGYLPESTASAAIFPKK